MRKTEQVQAIKVAPGEVLVVKPNRPMTGPEFELLGQQVEAESKRSGTEMVLIPFSAKVAGTQKKTTTKKTSK